MAYQIKIAGTLDQSWAGWLGDIRIDTELDEQGSAVTTLTTGPIDQPGLFGILDHLRDLNRILIAVNGIEKGSPEESQGKKP